MVDDAVRTARPRETGWRPSAVGAKAWLTVLGLLAVLVLAGGCRSGGPHRTTTSRPPAPSTTAGPSQDAVVTPAGGVVAELSAIDADLAATDATAARVDADLGSPEPDPTR